MKWIGVGANRESIIQTWWFNIFCIIEERRTEREKILARTDCRFFEKFTKKRRKNDDKRFSHIHMNKKSLNTKKRRIFPILCLFTFAPAAVLFLPFHWFVRPSWQKLFLLSLLLVLILWRGVCYQFNLSLFSLRGCQPTLIFIIELSWFFNEDTFAITSKHVWLIR